MANTKYYIYKYVINNQIVYIGQSINLKNRIAQHKKDKLRDLKNPTIYYFECQNKTAMNSWEYFLINKYHPIYNSALKDGSINIQMIEPSWKLYKDSDFLTIKKKETKEKQSEQRILDVDINILIKDYSTDNNEELLDYCFSNISLFEQKLMFYLLIKSKIQNQSLNEIYGTPNEYLQFCNIGDSGSLYKEIKKILENKNCLIRQNNSNEYRFMLTEKGVHALQYFQELDIDYLLNIIKYCQHKYTCFILNILLQLDNYTISVDSIAPYLCPSYTRNAYDLKKRVLEPSVKELNDIGFDLNYNFIKKGKKCVAINFI